MARKRDVFFRCPHCGEKWSTFRVEVKQQWGLQVVDGHLVLLDIEANWKESPWGYEGNIVKIYCMSCGTELYNGDPIEDDEQLHDVIGSYAITYAPRRPE